MGEKMTMQRNVGILGWRRVLILALFASFVGRDLWARSSIVTSSASDGEGSLREAFAVANDGDTITLAVSSGRIALTNELEILAGNFNRKGVTVNGNGVTLDGRGLCRIVSIGEDNRVTFSKVNFENGHGPDLGCGGAIYNEGELDISDSTIKNNGIYKGYTGWGDYASGSGGAIYNSGVLRISHAVAKGNVTSNSGGVLFNDGGWVCIEDVDFIDNGDGGYEPGNGYWGIFSQGGALSLDKAIFHDAHVNIGGGGDGRLVTLRQMDSVTLSNCSFTDNIISDDISSSLVYVSAIDLSIFNTVISNNVDVCEEVSPDPIFIFGGKKASISNVLYSGNNRGLKCCSDGRVNIRDSVFRDNESVEWGDAALILDGPNIIIDNCSFQDNVCGDGAVRCGHHSPEGCSNLVVRNSKFTSNRALKYKELNNIISSGALTAQGVPDSIVSNCQFVANSSDRGVSGAIGGFPYVIDCEFVSNKCSSAGAATASGDGSHFVRCSFVGNQATNGCGGAVSGYRATFDACNFVSNNATIYGGAIYSYRNRRFLVSDTRSRGWYHNVVKGCSFVGNSAAAGGAISGPNDRSGYEPEIMVYNSVFSGNRASGNGSAICSYTQGFNFLVANSTLVGNNGDSLVYGYGAMIGDIAVANGKYDYYYRVPARDGDGFPADINFAACSGQIGNANYVDTLGLMVDVDAERDMECLNDGQPLMRVDGSQGVDRVYYLPRTTGKIPGRGAFIWHDELWDNIAYSMSKESMKHALLGEASNAVICVDRDFLGQEIRYPACPGAVYCPAQKITTHTISFDALSGAAVASRTIENGMAVGELPISTREGHWLYGWYADASFKVAIDSTTQIDRDRVFYARWIPDVQLDGGPYSQFVDGIEWTYYVANGSSVIKSSGSVPAIANTVAGDIRVPSFLGGHAVREIGEYAFRGCTKLTSVIIPEGITNIGQNAFYNCIMIKSVTIPTSVVSIGRGAFYNCTGLSSVTIPGSVTHIEDSAFYGCVGMTSVTLSNGVRNIGYTAFRECRGLTALEIPSSVTNIGDSAFLYCVDLGKIVFRGEPPNGIEASRILANAKEVYYPQKYAKEYGLIVPPEIFAGYVDDDEPQELVIVTLQLATAMEMDEYEDQLECSGGTEPYRWSVDDADCLPVGLSLSEDGVIRGVPERAGHYSFAVTVRDDDDAEATKTLSLDVVANPSRFAVEVSGIGWHEVSFPVLPTGGDPADVFASVADKIGYVTYSSKNWSPTSGGTLTALEIGKGYWVQTTAANVSWTVTGQTNPDVEIALKAGWNLIGYPLLEEGEVEAVLATALATGKIDFIYSGSRVYPGTLTTMAPGKGYWVYANEAVTIKFDAK